MGEIDPNLWVALEDLQDGWVPSGQVGQEVYGAGIAFGIVPRQFYKIEKSGFMVFTEYPATGYKVGKDSLSFYSRGDSRLNFRMAILPIKDKLPAKMQVTARVFGSQEETIKPKSVTKNTYLEYTMNGDSQIKIAWEPVRK